MLSMPDFQIFEPVNSTVLLKNIVGADKYDVLFLEIAVGFTFVQGF